MKNSAINWRWEFFLGLVVLGLLSYTWMFGSITVPNERSRAYLVVALVDHHSLSIDKPIQRFGPIFDWARKDGRYYTDKAPGSSLLGTIPYLIVRQFTSAEDWSISKLINLMRTWVMLPIGAAGFFLIRRLLRRLNQSASAVDVVSLSWILGTSAFHYSTAYYGHQIVAVCLLASLDLVLAARQLSLMRDSSNKAVSRARIRMLGAGMLAGIAGLTEYQAGIPAAMLAAFAIFDSPDSSLLKRGGLAALIAVGAAPFAVLLFGYNKLAFGSPFNLSYHYLVDAGLQQIHGQGIGGVSVPRLSYAAGGFLSLHRGFLATSPIFLLALPGLVIMWRQGAKSLAVLVGAALIYFSLFISSTKIWFAGWGFGPRLLVPVMAWAMIPISFWISAVTDLSPRKFVWRVLQGMTCGLAFIGILYHQLVHSVFPELPENATNPLLDIVIPLLKASIVSPNLFSQYFGMQGLPSLVPLAILLSVPLIIVWWAFANESGFSKNRASPGGRGTVAGVEIRAFSAERFARRFFPITFVALATASLYLSLLVLAGPGWNSNDLYSFMKWLAGLGRV